MRSISIDMSEAKAEKSRAAVRLRRPERRQVAMVVQCPDDLVSAGHPVRLVLAVVEKLDLSRFHEPIKARAGEAGRDATDPQLLVALWLYACLRGIGSARELARRCAESAAFRWLCGGVGVNHRMLSDFRTGHGEALDALFTQVIASLVDKEVVAVSRVSQDGVRVRVSAGASSFRRQERLEKLLQEARQHVDQLRRQVDSPESAALSARQRAARQRAAGRSSSGWSRPSRSCPSCSRSRPKPRDGRGTASAGSRSGRGSRGSAPPMPRRAS